MERKLSREEVWRLVVQGIKKIGERYRKVVMIVNFHDDWRLLTVILLERWWFTFISKL